MLKYIFLFVGFVQSVFFSSSITYALGNKAVIDGIYATSTALPYNDYFVSKIFDGDQSTYWKTMPGAAIDEGIMIIFEKPTFISSVNPIFAKGDALDKVDNIEVYGDGQSFWNGERVNTKLSSLYIRISGAASTSTSRGKHGSRNYSRLAFPVNLSVGISELELYGKNKERLEVTPPTYHEGTVTVTSSLDPEIAYGKDNLMDCRKEFGWAEGNKNNGIGEQIVFQFENEIELGSIKLWNGYQRSPTHFSSNTRLKQFRFGPTGGDLAIYTLEDSKDAQIVKLKTPLKGSEFVLAVVDVYAGTKYRDLVISEIHFSNRDGTMLIKSAESEIRIKDLRNTANPILKAFLDRNISVTLSEVKKNETKSEYYNENNSMIIRSNNTFVLYQRKSTYIEEADEEMEMYDGYEEDKMETISDGNWELVEANDSQVKIRIFGKIFTPTTAAELYKGDVTSTNVRIFQDYLTITSDKISGERFVEDIIIK